MYGNNGMNPQNNYSGQYPNNGMNSQNYGQYPNNGMQPQNMYQPPKKSNTGLVVGIILFLIIAAVVVIFVVKPFDKDTDKPDNSTPPTETTPPDTTNPPQETNPPEETTPPTETTPPEETTPPTTQTTGYSCTNSVSESGIKMLVSVDVTDGGNNSCKLDMTYTYSRENGQAFTEAEKESVSSSLESSLKSSSGIGTVVSYSSELKNGSIKVYVVTKLDSCTPSLVKSEFTSENYVCKELG